MKNNLVIKGITTLLLALPFAVLAQSDKASVTATHSSNPRGPLVSQVREATWIYRNVSNAEAAGYVPTACASGPNGGAMGVHYVNPGLLFNADGTPSGEFEIDTPEVLIYEPLPNGILRLVGVEYIVFADPWDAAHDDGASPVANGQLFHFAGAPNRYRLPAFYELHEVGS